MDFYEIAKKMELEGKKFYEEQAALASIPQLVSVFKFLAQEEQGHYELFSALQAKGNTVPLKDNSVLARAKDAFAKEYRKIAVPSTINDIESAYNKALDAEKHAVAFYTAESAKLADSRQKGEVALVIEQEKQHVKLFEGLIEFIRQPKEWLENAEFNHLDEY
jgi:rubrerythrin